MPRTIAKATLGLALLVSLGACAGGPYQQGYTRPGDLVPTQQFVTNVLTENGVIGDARDRKALGDVAQ